MHIAQPWRGHKSELEWDQYIVHCSRNPTANKTKKQSNKKHNKTNTKTRKQTAQEQNKAQVGKWLAIQFKQN